jgi:hypothetical protein
MQMYVQWNLHLSFQDNLFSQIRRSISMVPERIVSTMAPASTVFPDPLFLFQTPDENDE